MAEDLGQRDDYPVTTGEWFVRLDAKLDRVIDLLERGLFSVARAQKPTEQP